MAKLSVANRAEAWNTFCVSTAPYPATILPITKDVAAALQHHPCTVWMRQNMIADLGMLLNLRGTPRDRSLIADTATIMMYDRGGIAGPYEKTARMDEAIATIQAWALATTTCAPVSCYPTRRLTKAAQILEQAGNGLSHFRRKPGVAGALYTALWVIRRRSQACRYLEHRSRSHRWKPSNDCEWPSMSGFSHWAEACVTARIYGNGLPGSARTRPRTELEQTTCWGCQNPRPLRWKWMSGYRSPVGEQATIGWCEACTQNSNWGAGPYGGNQRDEPGHDANEKPLRGHSQLTWPTGPAKGPLPDLPTLRLR